jgi:hypothetical protein
VVVASWTIVGTGTLDSQSGHEACFTFPVNIDNVQSGPITGFALTVMWPMPPGGGPATGSTGTVPVSIHDGQSVTASTHVCLSPVPDVTLAGSPPMVASLTYYGSLANGQTSQFAGYDDFTQ